MWLTGFDAPCLHTMYVDKPMRGHGLMQAIARVNRVFRDKPGGLVVDYLGLADQLKQAIADYTESGGGGRRPSTRPRPSPSCWRSTRSPATCFHGFDFTPARGPWSRPRGSRCRRAHGARPRAGGRQAALHGRGEPSSRRHSPWRCRHDEALDPRRRGLLPDGALAARQARGRRERQDRRGAGRRRAPDRLARRGARGWAYILDINGGEQKDISILDDELPGRDPRHAPAATSPSSC